MAKSTRVVIHGHVQGVGYRAWTVTTARGFNLIGWVRNRLDGTVEAAFHGEETAIVQMLEACKEGPPAAQVKHIEQFAHDEMPERHFVSKPTV